MNTQQRKDYQRDYQKIYRQLTAEKRQLYQKVYREQNPEKMKEYQKNRKSTYVKKNKPKLDPVEKKKKHNITTMRYYYANREKILAYCNTQVTCCCGASITRKYKPLHLEKPVHERRLKQLYLNELSYYNF